MKNIAVALKCLTCTKEVCNQQEHLDKINSIIEKAENEEELTTMLKDAECQDYEE